MPFDATPSYALLNLTDAERDALTHVRDALASGWISPQDFDMRRYGSGPCCIGKHMQKIMYDRCGSGFDLMDSRFAELFHFCQTGDSLVYAATPAQAVVAIDSFLATGRPHWARALASV